MNKSLNSPARKFINKLAIYTTIRSFFLFSFSVHTDDEKEKQVKSVSRSFSRALSLKRYTRNIISCQYSGWWIYIYIYTAIQRLTSDFRGRVHGISSVYTTLHCLDLLHSFECRLEAYTIFILLNQFEFSYIINKIKCFSRVVPGPRRGRGQGLVRSSYRLHRQLEDPRAHLHRRGCPDASPRRIALLTNETRQEARTTSWLPLSSPRRLLPVESGTRRQAHR